MSKDNPVFVYGAVYADRDDADADYDTLLDLHSADLVGTYDVALVYKDDEGKVHVTKHEKPTQHGAWTGAAVGALVGIIFPPAILGSALVGAAAGGGIGHVMGGMSRGDAKELGDYLDTRPGRAGRDRQVAPSGAARQGAHACARRPKRRKSTPTARSSPRNSTRYPPSSSSSWPAALAPPLAWRCESATAPSTRAGVDCVPRPLNGPSRQASTRMRATDTSPGSARDRDERRDDARWTQPDPAGRAASPRQPQEQPG